MISSAYRRKIEGEFALPEVQVQYFERYLRKILIQEMVKSQGSLDNIFSYYKEALPTFDDYITFNGKIDFKKAEKIFYLLSQFFILFKEKGRKP